MGAKRIGILTGGGDCPGLNAVIRAIVRKGVSGLGASNEGSPFLSRAFAEPDAWVVRGQGGADVVVSDRITAMMRVQAQYSTSPLLPYEQISLGTTVLGWAGLLLMSPIVLSNPFWASRTSWT